MTSKTTIFWFRQDLRISDNPGLFEAAKNGLVMPIYILDDKSQMGAASKWWLHNSLHYLNKNLDNKLNVYSGSPKDIIFKIIEKNNINSVYWNRCYEPDRIELDTEIKRLLKINDIGCKSFNGSLLWEPWDILKSDKTPYKIYTYFYRKGCMKSQPPREPLPIPLSLELIQDPNNKTTIDELKLLPETKWYTKLEKKWVVGEESAQNKLEEFLKKGLSGYREKRNFPARHNVSNLSPHLHFGEISPNQIWYNTQNHLKLRDYPNDLDCFLSEIAWREFSYYLLYHFPYLPYKNLNSKFDKFPWHYNIGPSPISNQTNEFKGEPALAEVIYVSTEQDLNLNSRSAMKLNSFVSLERGDSTKLLEAWRHGQTGYPIIDSGMRQLWQTGYMHNRVRMIAASFLVKNLLIDWRIGADWFWDCLVDADLASNSANWQWVAGSGTDAAPYFRIFNPVLQSEKFDPDGTYIRQFVPELSKLPTNYLFKPWDTPASILKDAGVLLGETYPMPIIDFQLSRDRALDIYSVQIKT